jgi:hypothetical protein
LGYTAIRIIGIAEQLPHRHRRMAIHESFAMAKSATTLRQVQTPEMDFGAPHRTSSPFSPEGGHLLA